MDIEMHLTVFVDALGNTVIFLAPAAVIDIIVMVATARYCDI